MKMNEFLKQIASDKRKLGKELNKDDYYLMLKYTGINKDQSLVNDIEEFYQNFLENLNNSLVRHVIRKTGEK